MKQKKLAVWLKAIVILTALIAAVIYAFVVPVIGTNLSVTYPECAYCFIPWLLLIWATGIPVFFALILAWKVFHNIGLDKSFTCENGRRLSAISMLAGADAALFFAGNVVFLILNMNHPGIVLLSAGVSFVGAGISVASAALSHLVYKAAALEEDSALTI